MVQGVRQRTARACCMVRKFAFADAFGVGVLLRRAAGTRAIAYACRTSRQA
ncbi:hypothetical protein EDD95_4106 [Streptomyces sp. CEV 2-1]|nr:hypothetical protein EDD95_4106 [Streptomyces sp. CEV 2-1]